MTETFQLTREQAQAYDDLFVPTLFGQWAPQLLDCARVCHGQSVLDVACGTGVVARAARDVAQDGRVVGVDLNPAMLEVAREARPELESVPGDAEDLPFADAEFDVALCQSALFFFADPGRAVAEMARVVVPGGVVALQTYAPLAEQPAYGPFVELVAGHVGPEARILLGTYWSQGDVDGLLALTSAAGLSPLEWRSSLGEAIFPSAAAVAHTEIQARPRAAPPHPHRSPRHRIPDRREDPGPGDIRRFPNREHCQLRRRVADASLRARKCAPGRSQNHEAQRGGGHPGERAA